MIYSMTGFGKANFMIKGTAYAVEIRSLNSKQLDLNVRIPTFLREKEMAIRKIIGDEMQRGKTDISIYSEKKEENNSFIINKNVVLDYQKQIQEITFNSSDDNFLEAILKLPNVLQAEENTLNPEAWTEIEKGIKEAMSQLNLFRFQEGNALKKDLLMRNKSIEKLAKKVETLAPNRIIKIQNRISKNIQKIKDRVEINVDRFEQELIFYLEKIDINEEIVRLQNHNSYFKEIIAEKTISKGKKIGFIAQEIGREINTISSKANDSEIQKLAVQMKNELEKIKEQSFNIL